MPAGDLFLPGLNGCCRLPGCFSFPCAAGSTGLRMLRCRGVAVTGYKIEPGQCPSQDQEQNGEVEEIEHPSPGACCFQCFHGFPECGFTALPRGREPVILQGLPEIIIQRIRNFFHGFPFFALPGRLAASSASPGPSTVAIWRCSPRRRASLQFPYGNNLQIHKG